MKGCFDLEQVRGYFDEMVKIKYKNKNAIFAGMLHAVFQNCQFKI